MILWCRPVDLATATLLVRRERPIDGWDGKVAWIGIEPLASPLNKYPQRSQLLISIPDTVSMKESFDSRAGYYSDLPTLDMARKILAFCDNVHRSKSRYALIVHCTMGLSRSTATALWARARYGIANPPISSDEERHWMPNPTLERVLLEASK